MNVIGLDVGGANIKACDADGKACSLSFPLWKQADRLAETLQTLISEFAAADLVGLTMTGELADCFETKADGVTAIIRATEQACGKLPLRVWMTSGEFAEPDDAVELPPLVAAANWHALATWAALGVPDGPALLVDTGSTTTDIIPLLDGHPVPAGLTDSERLVSRELVYSGAGRTPICALLSEVEIGQRTFGIAAEWFATMADAYVVAGERPELPEISDTADGRPLTKVNSANRLAHLICCDRTEVSSTTVEQIALAAIREQRRRIADAVSCVQSRLQDVMEDQQRTLDKEELTLIVSGSGGKLVSDTVATTLTTPPVLILTLADVMDQPVADAACAFAVARLAQDRCVDDLLEVSHF